MVANLGPNQCPSKARKDSRGLKKKLEEWCNYKKGNTELDLSPVWSERGQKRMPGRKGIGKRAARSLSLLVCLSTWQCRGFAESRRLFLVSCSIAMGGFVLMNISCPSFPRIIEQLRLEGRSRGHLVPAPAHAGPPHFRRLMGHPLIYFSSDPAAMHSTV